MANEYKISHNVRYSNLPPHQPHRAPERKADNKPDIVMKKNTAKKGSATGIFIAAACVLVLLSFVIYGKSETNKLYTEIAQASQVQQELESENKRMKTEIEAKMGIKNVEEYAESVLGLKKLDQTQIEYIQIQTDDQVKISEEDTDIFVKIKKGFEKILEYIFD